MAPVELATVADIEGVFRPLDEAEHGMAEHLLRMAQALVRAEIPGIDRRITAGALDPELVRDVVVAMTVRVLRNPDLARGRSQTAGPFTSYLQFDATTVGLGLLPVEVKVLSGPARRAPGMGMIRLGSALGWP